MKRRRRYLPQMKSDIVPGSDIERLCDCGVKLKCFRYTNKYDTETIDLGVHCPSCRAYYTRTKFLRLRRDR